MARTRALLHTNSVPIAHQLGTNRARTQVFRTQKSRKPPISGEKWKSGWVGADPQVRTTLKCSYTRVGTLDERPSASVKHLGDPLVTRVATPVLPPPPFRRKCAFRRAAGWRLNLLLRDAVPFGREKCSPARMGKCAEKDRPEIYPGESTFRPARRPSMPDLAKCPCSTYQHGQCRPHRGVRRGVQPSADGRRDSDSQRAHGFSF